MWNDHLVGTVVRTGSDFPEEHGRVELSTKDESLIAFFRAARESAKRGGTEWPEGFDPDFVDRLFEGWTLVDRAGVVEKIAAFPFLDLEERSIVWRTDHTDDPEPR